MPFLILLFSLLSLPCFAQSGIDSLLQVVLSNNLELKALSAENDALSYDLKSDNTISGPTVEYSPFYTKGYHGMASSELIVSQEFDFPTRYAQRRRQGELEMKSASSAYEVMRRQLALQARLLCLDIIRQNQLINLLTERMHQGEDVASLLQKRLEAGDANVIEVNKARLDLMQATQQLTEEQNTRKGLLSQLALLNGGQPLEVNLSTFPTLTSHNAGHESGHEGHASDMERTGDVGKPSDMRYVGNAGQLPEVSLAERQLEASQHNEKVARQSWLPSISVGYRRNTDESLRLNGFLVGASFPLFSTSSKVKSAQSRTKASELQLLSAQHEAQLAQQARYDQLQQLASVLDHSDTKLLRETLTLLNKAMEQGQLTSLQYYTECADIYERLASHITLHCDYVKLYSELYLR